MTTAARVGAACIACSASPAIALLTGKVANRHLLDGQRPGCQGRNRRAPAVDRTRPSHQARPAAWQYTLIAAEAARIGRPTLYAEDLTNHDAYTLGTRQPAVFLWMLRECGTWLRETARKVEGRGQPVWRPRPLHHVTHAGLRTLTPEFAAFRFAS